MENSRGGRVQVVGIPGGMPTCKNLRRKVDFQKDHCKIPGRSRDKMNWESTSKKIVMGWVN